MPTEAQRSLWPASKPGARLYGMGELLQRAEAFVDRVALAVHRRKFILIPGVFDGLTAEQAAQLTALKARLSQEADSCLCVALRSDAAHTALTGVAPAFSEQKRVQDLAYIPAVDWIILSDDAGGQSLIEGLVPDILVKPSCEPVPGEDSVRETGGVVEVCTALVVG